MRHLLTSVRPGERLTTAIAFLTLMVVMSGHAVLETARDALFLSSIPASRLPWVYLGIAAIALVVQRLESRIPSQRLHVVLGGWLALSAAITLGFWHFLPRLGEVGLYTLYVWSGTMASLILLHFWSLLSSYVTVADAKRLFATIGVGSALGAIGGSGLAAVLATVFDARHLLLVTSATLFVAMLGPYALGRWGGDPIEKRDEHEGAPLMTGFRSVFESPYLVRVALLVVVGTLTVTFVDIVFKSIAADRVESAQLAEFFALTYLGLNLVSLLVQVFVVRPVIRSFSVAGALAILPSLLLTGGVAALFGGGLAAALGMKAADGALRHSLNRTALELLYVPLSNKVRVRVKAVVDVVGQRAGQALGSLLILGGIALGLDEDHFLAAAVLLALAWILIARSLKGPYLDIFRNVLRGHTIVSSLEHPDLDLAGLETLLQALNSPDDSRVIAAMNILAEEGKTSVIPALILYHPSTDVVIRALELFMAAERTDYFSIATRIEEDAPSSVKAALLAAIASHDGATEFVIERAQSDDEVVRATARFLLSIMEEAPDDGAFHQAFEDVLATGSTEARIALANAIGMMRAEGCRDELIQLLYTIDPSVRLAALRAMARVRNLDFIDPIRDLMADRRLRRQAVEALVEFGEPAMYQLASSLRDSKTAVEARRQIPRAVAAFHTAEAADLLVRALPEEQDGMVRYRIVRELERLRMVSPRLDINSAVLRRSIEFTIENAYRLLDWQITIGRELDERPELETETAELLADMVRDKLEHAVDLLIRQLGLFFPREDFSVILRGLWSADAQRRASSRELLDHVTYGPLRGPVLGLVDEGPDEERIYAAGPFYEPKHLDYETLLRLMIDGESDTLRLLAVHHIGELGLQVFRPRLEEIRSEADRSLRAIVNRALGQLLASELRGEPSHA